MKSKMKFLKQGLIVMTLMIGAITMFSALPIAGAAILNDTDNPAVISEGTGGETSIRALALRIINYFLGFLGLVAVIMIIYGGISYVTSAGNDEAVGKAKKVIMYAIIGLVIVLLSFVIIRAVLGAGTGTE